MPLDKFEKLNDYVEYLEKLVAECYSSQYGQDANSKIELSENDISTILGLYKYAEENISQKPQEFAIDERLVTCRILVRQLMKLKDNFTIKIDDKTLKYIQFIIDLVDMFRPYVLGIITQKKK